jgi:hypothetical protein
MDFKNGKKKKKKESHRVEPDTLVDLQRRATAGDGTNRTANTHTTTPKKKRKQPPMNAQISFLLLFFQSLSAHSDDLTCGQRFKLVAFKSTRYIQQSGKGQSHTQSR